MARNMDEATTTAIRRLHESLGNSAVPYANRGYRTQQMAHNTTRAWRRKGMWMRIA
jgi:hypothetical protein